MKFTKVAKTGIVGWRYALTANKDDYMLKNIQQLSGMGSVVIKKYLTISFALFLIYPVLLYAQEQPIDAFEETCCAANSTTAGMANCTYEAQQRWDGELNRYYKLLGDKLTRNQKEALKKAQRAWMLFRDVEFERINSTYGTLSGTMYINIAAADKKAIVKERAAALQSAYHVLTVGGEDTTAKIKPVPDVALVDDTFTYKGKPIHPFLLKEFSNWDSDNRPPMITSVDVKASFDTNKYQTSEIEKRESWWFAKTEAKDEDATFYESFGYHWLGKLANGVHVLETGSGGGGSGFFMDLMFVRFSKGKIFWENKKEDQLLMTIVGTYSLSDRYEADIKVKGNTVLIPATKSQHGGGAQAKDIELELSDL